MSYAPKRESSEFEQLETETFLKSKIVEVQEDWEHEFKFEGKTKIKPAVRFKFSIEGYQYPHYSRWMSFAYINKATLYSKYITKLVDGAFENMNFDIQQLKNIQCATYWTQKEYKDQIFQNLELIKPLGEKLKYTDEKYEEQEDAPF